MHCELEVKGNLIGPILSRWEPIKLHLTDFWSQAGKLSKSVPVWFLRGILEKLLHLCFSWALHYKTKWRLTPRFQSFLLWTKCAECLGSVVPLAMFCDYFPLILDAYVMGVYSTKLPLFWIANPSHVEAGNSDKSWKISGLTHSQVAPCFTSQHLSPLSSVLEFWLKTSQENITWFKNLFFLCPF